MTVDAACEIAVFAKGTRTSGLPWFRASYEDAAYYVQIGLAVWVNRKQKSILFTMDHALSKARDRSCSMGPSVIIGYVLGQPAERALVEAWRPVAA